MNENKIVFIDLEVDRKGKKIVDIGAIASQKEFIQEKKQEEFHQNILPDFLDFIKDCQYICGHNILNHDLRFIDQEIIKNKYYIDTLYFSPLLFPKKPYHHLLKDDKLIRDELNNPLNDAKKAKDLFNDEIAAFHNLDDDLKRIYYLLLCNREEFKSFFKYIDYQVNDDVVNLISKKFDEKICTKSPIEKIVEKYPVELAFALSQINVIQYDSLTPAWILVNYPRVENILHILRSKNCQSCPYCLAHLDEYKALNKFFHYPDFRLYNGQPLQQQAVKAAIDGKSLLAVFPTGGGKSITFQLPALMAGVNEKGLTVIISPLQSLMKDQTDNLEVKHSITEAVTINGSLDPLERAKAYERVEDGSASILYISPESLRSRSIEILLVKRNIVRFVIDEAHCFSSWGQDFRVDYLYIGEFIKNLQLKKEMMQNIPVSCFTATAKPRVIADIKNYFQDKLNLELETFVANSGRSNLNYHILNQNDSGEKYLKLRQLIEEHDCPTIIYVSRTKRAEDLAEKLTKDGFLARHYHGKMDKRERIANQDLFMQDQIKIIVATTAFGMGVDKKDVGLVIHYDISDSLENYIQEAGRAGRDEKIEANCFILFDDDDLNSHFYMLNQTKMLKDEIQQIWKAVKDLTKTRNKISQTPLEMAVKAGWPDNVHDKETRVKTAVNALEQSGFIKRGQNMPRVFADSILVKNMEEARTKIDSSTRFDDQSRKDAIRIMSNLISAKNKAKGLGNDGEARIDYISDILGISKENIIKVIRILREEKILADDKDLIAYLKKGEKSNKVKNLFYNHKNVEEFLLSYLDESEKTYNIKEINEQLEKKFTNSTMLQLKTILNYYHIKKFIKKTQESNLNYLTIRPYFAISEIARKTNIRFQIAEFIIDYLYASIRNETSKKDDEEVIVGFSVRELKESYEHNLLGDKAESEDIEDALYYLLKIGALKIEGGFLILYNAIQIERIEKNTKAQYKNEHYAQLAEYYENKKQQIHIVGEYANRMTEDYNDALNFVNDYFTMDYNLFIEKYFKDEKRASLEQNMSPKKNDLLFKELSLPQKAIVIDKKSQYIIVAAGPGSGKTRVLTRKLASICLTEDVKHEQMLMLTFSRAAATEFKKKLIALIGNPAHFIQITTFHSYCFDMLGKVGDLEKVDTIIEQAIEKIKADEVDITWITKMVLVIDEAQDMSEVEYKLVKTLMEKNENMRIIAVGDDDQNIYEFRKSDSKYFLSLINEEGAKKYELLDNYRSRANIIQLANGFATNISKRIKTLPINAIKKENGEVHITKVSSNHIETIVVNQILKKELTGSTCVIVRTNEEVLNIVGLLNKHGKYSRQIQTNTDFNLYNLVEFRWFANQISKNDSSAIAEEIWEQAKKEFNEKYVKSSNLSLVNKLIKEFEETNGKTKYKSDFIQYIKESKLDDFIDQQEGEILVSTIHQTKGKEFNNVFLALGNVLPFDDEIKRSIYVAITRAIDNLYITYKGNYLDNIKIDNCIRTEDNNIYPEPIQIALQLSHKDVYLGYFYRVQKAMSIIKSGIQLSIIENGCKLNNTQIIMFSTKFKEEIEKLKKKGYYPTNVIIKHIIYWGDKNKNKEIKIGLPYIEFSK